mgnify:FL=1
MLKIKDKLLSNYRFIDLFCGIGGFHNALSSFGAKCVFASDINKHATNIYEKNFNLKPFGDITKINTKDIPKHDILAAGFPCQAFSIAGKKKGFDDTRGTLFFEIIRISKEHKPKILILENVKNLISHDDGRTIKIIKKTLENLDYKVYYKILNTSNFGLPQSRKRIYFVCFKKNILKRKFYFPIGKNKQTHLSDFLEKNPKTVLEIKRNDINYKEKIDLGKHNKTIRIGTVGKGGQGERIYDPRGHAITLSAYGGGIGSKTGLYKIDEIIRKLTPRECARIQGFPENFIIDTSSNQAYKQFGNSVSINVVQHIIQNIIFSLD